MIIYASKKDKKKLEKELALLPVVTVKENPMMPGFFALPLGSVQVKIVEKPYLRKIRVVDDTHFKMWDSRKMRI